MWEYKSWLEIVDEYESYNGYTQKYDKPLHVNHHQIIRLGSTGNVLEVIVHSTAIANSKNDKRLRENYRAIVEAVNGRQVEHE